MNTLIPTLVNTASWRVPTLVANAYGDDMYLWTSFYFITSGSFATGYLPDDFESDAYEALSETFAGLLLPYNWGADSAWTINTPAGLKQAFFDFYFFQPTYLIPTLQTQCINIFLQTSLHTRRGKGRLSWSWLINEDMDGSKVTPHFIERMIPLLNFWTTGFTAGGVNFVPAVWSRADNVFRSIIKVGVGDRASWCSRRSPWTTKPRTPIVPPFVW